jgi:hypothetical protein
VVVHGEFASAFKDKQLATIIFVIDDYNFVTPAFRDFATFGVDWFCFLIHFMVILNYIEAI